MNVKLSISTRLDELIYSTCGVMTDRDSAHPHDQKRLALGTHVVARPKVSLAKGERNEIRWRTRSVLHFQMREQSLSTTVRDVCRAFDQISDKEKTTHSHQRTNNT